MKQEEEEMAEFASNNFWKVGLSGLSIDDLEKEVA